MRSLPILYHDDILVAVNKPSGMLVHRSFVDRHADVFAMQVLRDQLGRWVYPLHRIDKGTSGVLLFALDQDTARTMTEVFSAGGIGKSYLAVVRGYTDEAGRIDHPIKERWDRMTDLRANPDKPAKDAVTEYRRLATVEVQEPVGRYATARYSLISASPRTGRKHQIRKHMKHIFHPVIGDTTYGDTKQNEFFRTRFSSSRLLLHAAGLSFVHPSTNEQVRIEAPPDDAFLSVVAALGWHGVDLSCFFD